MPNFVPGAVAVLRRLIRCEVHVKAKYRHHGVMSISISFYTSTVYGWLAYDMLRLLQRILKLYTAQRNAASLRRWQFLHNYIQTLLQAHILKY